MHAHAKNNSLLRFIYSIRWLLYVIAIGISAFWVWNTQSNESWTVLIGLLLGILADLAATITSLLPESARLQTLYLNKLQSQLDANPGLHNYVPLKVTSPGSSHPIVDPDHILRFPQCLILGEPGTGKTTLLARLANFAIHNWRTQSDHQFPFPIWLDLAHWRTGDLKTFIRQQTGFPFSMLAQMSIAVFVDNFELATQGQAQQIEKWLADPHAPVRATLAFRTTPTRSAPYLRLPTTALLASALDAQQIDQFIQNYLGQNAEPLRSILLIDTLSPTQMQSLAATYPQAKDPALLLRILTDGQEREEALPPMAQPSEVPVDDVDIRIPNPYRAMIANPQHLAAFLRGYHTLSEAVTPFNIGAMMDLLLPSAWQHYTARCQNSLPPWPYVSQLLSAYALSRKQENGTFPYSAPLSTAIRDLAIEQKYLDRPKRFGWILFIWELITWLLTLPLYLLMWLIETANLYTRVPYRLHWLFEWTYKLRSAINAPSRAHKNRTSQLIQHMVAAGLLQLTPDDQVTFPHTHFFEYFAGLQIDRYFQGHFQAGSISVPYNDLWNRYYTGWDRIVIAAVGISKQRKQLLEALNKRDTILYAKCILSLHSTEIALVQNKLVEDLESLMLHPTNSQADEDRVVECARILYHLSDVSLVDALLKAIRLAAIKRFQERLVSIIVRYGSLAVPRLCSALSTADITDSAYVWIIRSLGLIGDPRGIQSIQEQLALFPKDKSQRNLYHEGHEPILRATLARLIQDQHLAQGADASQDQYKTILLDRISPNSDYPHNERLRFWVALAEIGPTIIPDLIAVMEQSYIVGRNQDLYFEKVVIPERFIADEAIPILTHHYQQTQHVHTKVMLINALTRFGDHRVIPLLLEAITDQDSWLRSTAIEAAGKLKARPALDLITAHLTDREPSVRAAAATALGRLGDPSSVRALRQILDDQTLVYEFSLSPELVCEAAINALRALDTSEARKLVISWCEQQLQGSDRKSRPYGKAIFHLQWLGEWEIISRAEKRFENPTASNPDPA